MYIFNHCIYVHMYFYIFIVELLGVLNWCDKLADDTLRDSLQSLQHVPGEEIVKFLQDILDALFSILTQVHIVSNYSILSC